MEILLANPRGFCAGVNMAIECLQEAIRMFGTNIYVYHEIVHNKYVVDRFTGRDARSHRPIAPDQPSARGGLFGIPH